jgi:TRAP transporter TAXI family solute receptor
MKKAVLTLVMLLCGAAAAQAQSQSGPPYRLTLAGASAGGLWSQLGVGVDQAVAAAYPGSTITYQTSGGGLANLPLVAAGRVPMGIALDAEIDIAIKGEDPFKEPVKGVRTLARLYEAQINYMLVTKDFADKHGIKSLEDLAAKKPPVRVAMNRRGNATGKISALFFEAVGITPQAIESWGGQVIYAASGEQANLAMDRRIDMIHNGLFVPDRSVLQVANSVPLVWLTTTSAVVEKVAKESAGKTYTVKAGAYPWLTHDVLTTAHGAVITVSEKMDDQTAYNLSKAITENVSKISGQSAALASVDKKVVSTGSIIPFHPGAEKYYREAGLVK